MTYITLKQNQMNELNFKHIKLDKEFIKFTISTNLCSTLDLPVTHLIPIIINNYLGLAEISVYKVLEKLGNLVSLAVGIINQVIAPEISKKISMNDISGALKISLLIRKVIFVVGIVVLFIISITHKLWMGLFIINYENYLIAIYLYFIYIIYTGAFSGQHPLFVFSGFVKYNIYILLIINSIYILLLIYMIKYGGLNGLILSRILQATAVFSIKAIILKRGLKY